MSSTARPYSLSPPEQKRLDSYIDSDVAPRHRAYNSTPGVIITRIWLPIESPKLQRASQTFRDRSLLVASKLNQLYAIGAVVASGANVNNVAKWAGVTPLIEATIASPVSAVKKLLALRADASIRENGRLPETAQHKAARLAMQNPIHQTARYGHTETLTKMLIPGSGDFTQHLDTRDRFNAMPLHEASASGRLKIVWLLLEESASSFYKAMYIGIPLHVATDRGDSTMAAMILGPLKGEKMPRVGEHDVPPLHVAATGGHKDIVKMIVARWPKAYRRTDRYG
ncbi:ankyrin repeat-containing domain protein [Xylariaceae sp. FL0255]|nr:ankyrin repeat-containing domain protein [Xylariaceae sp. FL0255]